MGQGAREEGAVLGPASIVADPGRATANAAPALVTGESEVAASRPVVKFCGVKTLDYDFFRHHMKRLTHFQKRYNISRVEYSIHVA